LSFPDHLAERFHNDVFGLVRAYACSKALVRRANAWRLINRNLFLNRKMHRHMQGGIGAPAFYGIVALFGFGILEVGTIFRMLCHASCRDRLEGRENAARFVAVPGVRERLTDLFA